MTKNLVIVESPAKSKTIEKFLGRNYSVKASMGHLRDLPKSQFGVDIDHGFAPKYINIRGKGDLIKALKTAAKKADKILLATDPDREGEAIAWHLAHILDIDEQQLCRIEFHEITKDAVKTALTKPKALDLDKVDAQQTRRILDRIVGYQLSPLLWRKIRKGLSAGRVQSVAVKIICDRQKEIEKFEPEEYWTIAVKLREKPKSMQFTADLVKFKNKKIEIKNTEAAARVVSELKQAQYTVSNSVRRERKKKSAPPLTTSTLQQEAFRKLNFTTKKTMMLAQQLYEGVNVGSEGSVGLITYMRTDSVRLSDNAVEEIRGFIREKYGASYLPSKVNVFSAKKNAQDAHEAIRPSSVQREPDTLERFLSKDQLRLYRLIWQRTVACQMAEAVFDQTTLTIEAGDYTLSAGGSVMKFDGFLHLSDRKDMGEEKEKTVPELAIGTKLAEHKVEEGKQHFTEPPPYFTEASLVKELEDKGIGRPSTYSPTIQTILERRYVAKDGKKLVATELGFLTIELLTNYFQELIDISFSAELEDHLDQIAEHKLEKETVLTQFYKPFSEALAIAEKEIPVIELPDEVSDIPCDKCGRMMVYKNGRFGRFLACPGFPECRNTKAIVKKIGVHCPLCEQGELIERKSKRGRIFYGCDHYPECQFTSWDKPVAKKCPVCGSLLAEKKQKNGKVLLHCINEQCKYTEEQEQ